MPLEYWVSTSFLHILLNLIMVVIFVVFKCFVIEQWYLCALHAFFGCFNASGKIVPKKVTLSTPFTRENKTTWRIMQLFLSTPLAICFLYFLNSFVVCEISDYFVLHCHTSLHFNNYWFYIELIWFFTSWADFVCTRATFCSPLLISGKWGNYHGILWNFCWESWLLISLFHMIPVLK